MGLALPAPPVVGLALATGIVALAAVVSPARFLLLCGFCLLAGTTAGSLSTPREPVGRPTARRQVDAVVISSPTRAPEGCTVEVAHTWLARRQVWRPGPSRATLRLRGPCPSLRPSTRLRFTTRLRPGGPNRPWRATLPRGGLVPVGRVPAAKAQPWTQRLRVRMVRSIAPWRGRGRALLAAVVVGERQWLRPHERERFRRTGTAHLLAISGLHVGLVTALCLALVRRLWGRLPGFAERLAPTRAAALGGLAATWIFVAVSGAATPALRAGIMATALLLGPVWGRRSHPWAALATAAVVLLLWDPAQLTTPGFQLSFVAVAAILTVTPYLRGDGWRGRLLQLCGVTAAATGATLPLVAHHFGRASLAGLLLNLLVVPLFASLVVPLGLLGTLLALVLPTLGEPVLGLAALTAELLQGIVTWGDTTLSSATGLRWRPSGLETACCYAGALGLRWIRRPWGRLVLAAAVATGLLCGLAGQLGPGGGAALRVVFVDVGKGDAAIVTFPDGRHALVDAPGPTRRGYNATRRRVLPALDRLGIRRLHLVIASHAHADHIGGLPEVLRHVPTGALWHGGGLPTALEARRLLRCTRELSVPLRRARNRRFGKVSMRVLAPRLRGRVHPHPLRSVNNNSLVILLRHPSGSVLFTGDLELGGEAALLARGPRLRATVLKVGHHGSHTATGAPFLRAVSPRLAILSAPGAQPGRPFPSPQVLRRLRRAGARPLVTGREGDITVTIAPWGVRYTTRSGHYQLTPKGWRPAPPWPSLRNLLKDPRILLP